MGKEQGEFSVIEVPAIIVSIETFVNLQKDAEKLLGFDGTSVLLYETGKKPVWVDQSLQQRMGIKRQKVP